MKKNVIKNNLLHAIFAGASLCLIGILLMLHGSILGDRTTNIATLMSILGMGTIAMTGARQKLVKKEGERR